MLTQYFQQLAAYVETGKELTRADFLRKIDRVVEIKASVKNIIHQTIFCSVNKMEDGNVIVV
jgi:hypothetical protein